LEIIDATRVLFLKGSPEEMACKHGKLMKQGVRSVVDHILYGVGVGSSFARNRWFFGVIESAEKRLLPFMDERYLREMDALAGAAGLEREEMRLANFFPELFHCSGFALTGAGDQGRPYLSRACSGLHERHRPGAECRRNGDAARQRHAWVNVSYAGFVGSVTP